MEEKQDRRLYDQISLEIMFRRARISVISRRKLMQIFFD